LKNGDVALILAAGAGRRLAMPVPKPLLPLPGLPEGHGSFLERHIALLTGGGVVAAVVVPEGDLEEYRFLEARGARLIPNPVPALESGSTVSVRVGLDALAEQGLLAGRDVLVMDCDIAYERMLLDTVLDNRSLSYVLVNPSPPKDDEEVRVYGRDGVPHLIGKGLSEVAGDYEPMGESVGIIRVAEADVGLLRRLALWLTGDPPRRRAYGFSRALSEHEEIWQYFCAMGRMAVCRLPAGTAFAECDTAADYEHILAEVLPAIRQRDGA
jgi:choline kinase